MENFNKFDATKKHSNSESFLEDDLEIDSDTEDDTELDSDSESLLTVKKINFVSKQNNKRLFDSFDSLNIELSKRSLEQTYNDFYRIEEIGGGKFRVTTPKSIIIAEDCYEGVDVREFDSWEQAKQHYLYIREKYETIVHDPISEIQISQNEKIAFSDFSRFNPQSAPTDEKYQVSDFTKKHLFSKEDRFLLNPNSVTYKNTIKDAHWKDHLFGFISDYCAKDGSEMMQKLKIKNLEYLTPRQAIELATSIVIDLTKYSQNDIGKNAGTTPADQDTVLQLLEKGLSVKNSLDWDNWEGNGVCRNFACAVKAIFEALQENQTQFNQLTNTYCFYDSGDRDKYYPIRKKIEPDYHAWNTFCTVSKRGEVNSTIIDVTWAQRNLETKEIEKLDYTLTRMEPYLYEISKNLPKTAPDKDWQLCNILVPYMVKVLPDINGGGYLRAESVRQFYAMRALEIMQMNGIPLDLPEDFLQEMNKLCLSIAEDATKYEIETMYQVAQKTPQLDFDKILDKYFKAIMLGGLNDNTSYDLHLLTNFSFIDNNLQKLFFEKIQSEDVFLHFKQSMYFRSRLRKLLPHIFKAFSPKVNSFDRLELYHLVFTQNKLHRDSDFKQLITNLISVSDENIQDNVGIFFDAVREKLQKLNNQQYEELKIDDIDDYQLIERYDEIYKSLGGF